MYAIVYLYIQQFNSGNRELGHSRNIMYVPNINDCWYAQNSGWRSNPNTMYDFHNSTDTLKFCTEKRANNKTFFCFSFDFDETW